MNGMDIRKFLIMVLIPVVTGLVVSAISQSLWPVMLFTTGGLWGILYERWVFSPLRGNKQP